MEYPEEITTHRLRLRGVRPTDAPVLYAEIMSVEQVAKYLTWRPATSVQEAADRLEGILEEQRAGQSMTWSIVTNDGPDEPIGMFTAWTTEQGQELGYCLTPDAWGHGFMTEAVTAVTNRLLAAHEVVRVWATCDVENTASVRVLDRAGFQREGLLRKCAVHPNVSSLHRDCLLYARIDEDETTKP